MLTLANMLRRLAACSGIVESLTVDSGAEFEVDPRKISGDFRLEAKNEVSVCSPQSYVQFRQVVVLLDLLDFFFIF